jgi:hypothetical protein
MASAALWRFAHFFAQFGVRMGDGTFFDDLLVAALHGAIAFAEVDVVAVGVAEDLELDVVGISMSFSM